MSKHARRIRKDTVGVLSFERRIADLTMKAYREYAPLCMDVVLPSLTAGLLDPLPPDLQALSLTQTQWEAILNRTLVPGVEEMMAQRIADRLEEEGIDLDDLLSRFATSTATVTPIAAEFVAGAALERVYHVPSIRDWQSQYLSGVTNRMVDTPNAVFRELSQVMDKGLAQGDGIDVLRRQVQKVLDVKGESWRRRAETVARTEATGAFNSAAHAAADVRQELYGIQLDKVWVSTIDSRTRKTHFAADGQRRPLNAKFKVGKAELDTPGDPRGRAEEVINCRCTMLELEPDEELPDEEDRQTERGDTDATVRNRVGGRVGDIQGEVDRRREEEGIVRARDDDDGEGLVAAANQKEHSMKRTWKGTLAPIGKPTGDNRIIKSDAKITFRTFPLFLAFQKTSAEGHMQSVVVGGITEASVEGDKIIGSGFMLDTPEAQEAISLMEENLIGVSIDPSEVVWEMVDADGNAIDYEELERAYMAGEDVKVLDAYAELSVDGATLVAHPAFKEAAIVLDPEDAEDVPDEEEIEEAEASLVASIAGRATNRGYYFEDPSIFEDPKFERATGMHVTADGRVQGHIAQWGTCHLGSTNVCKQPPHSLTNYAYFHTHEVQTSEGPVAVGRLTVGGGHADGKLGLQAATAHYDNVSTSWAFARAGEDEFGIWVSGVSIPGTPDQVLSEALACPMSGDWRRLGGNLEMIAGLAVNTPGFPVPRGYRNEDGQEYSLVASGATRPEKKRGGESLTTIVERAAALAATAAVEYHVKRERVDEKSRATLKAITARKMVKANALAARLKEA